MEYNYYLEQKYLYKGQVETRILTAAQAEALGYEDDYTTGGTPPITSCMWMDSTVWKPSAAI